MPEDKKDMGQKQIEEILIQERAKRKRRKRVLTAAGLLAAAGIILAGGFLFWGRHGPGEWKDDPNATTQKPLTRAEQQAQLQKAADESRFRFKMNTAPTVTWSGESVQEADWYIVNSMENPWDMEVVITSAQDGSDLYRSARLKPGEREMTGQLETTLEPGTYAAVATATAINPETGETAGTVSADLTLTVRAKQ